MAGGQPERLTILSKCTVRPNSRSTVVLEAQHVPHSIIQINIIRCQNAGIDTRIRGVKMLGGLVPHGPFFTQSSSSVTSLTYRFKDTDDQSWSDGLQGTSAADPRASAEAHTTKQKAVRHDNPLDANGSDDGDTDSFGTDLQYCCNPQQLSPLSPIRPFHLWGTDDSGSVNGKVRGSRAARSLVVKQCSDALADLRPLDVAVKKEGLYVVSHDGRLFCLHHRELVELYVGSPLPVGGPATRISNVAFGGESLFVLHRVLLYCRLRPHPIACPVKAHPP